MKPDCFGPLCSYARTQPCLVCGRCPSVAHHVKSRGSGGTDTVGKGSHGNVVPLCLGCHDRGHVMGWQTFQKRTGLDLTCEAEKLFRRYTGV